VWNDYEGSHIFEPVPGENEIEMQVAAVPLREVIVTPRFDDGSALTGPWPIRVRDEATSFEDKDRFTAASSLWLPSGRPFTLTIHGRTLPEAPMLLSGRGCRRHLRSASNRGAPELPDVAEPIRAVGATVDVSGLQDPIFVTQCAVVPNAMKSARGRLQRRV